VIGTGQGRENVNTHGNGTGMEIASAGTDGDGAWCNEDSWGQILILRGQMGWR